MRAVAVVVAGLTVISACGGVTESPEYVSLLAENEVLSDDLEDARVELGVAEGRLTELNDQLTDAQSQLSDAELDGSEVRTDFVEFLSYQLSNGGGLSVGQSECLGNALVDDTEARSSYLVLLNSTDIESSEARAAYTNLNDVFVDCGLDLPALEDDPSPTPPDEQPQALADVTRPVEVVGDPLPTLATADPAADPAIGTKAPVLVGEDYTGQPVRIDAAESGPTMVVVLAHWCPHCNVEIPRLNQLRDLDRIPDRVNVVAISSLINPSRANFPPDTWISQMDWTYAVLADGVDPDRDVFIGADAFGVSGVPFVTLIDGDGMVAARWAGESDPDQIVSLLDELVASG
jgi:thiol-disulfide isomerase/thioredoxin